MASEVINNKSKCLCFGQTCFSKKQSSPMKAKENIYLSNKKQIGIGAVSYGSKNLMSQRKEQAQKLRNDEASSRNFQSANFLVEQPSLLEFQQQNPSLQASMIQNFDEQFRNPRQSQNPEGYHSCDTEEVRQRNKVRIKTAVQKKNIQFVIDFPEIKELQLTFKYCCPICLRYFNHMLISSCCGNYICRLCIGDMAKKAKKNKQFIIKCSHCFETEFRLNDVQPEERVKFYTDTPFKFMLFSPGGHLKQSTDKRFKEGLNSPVANFQSIEENLVFKKSSQKVKISPLINYSEEKLKSLDFQINANLPISPVREELKQTTRLEIIKEDGNNERSRNEYINEAFSIQRSLSGESLQNQLKKLQDSQKSLIFSKERRNSKMIENNQKENIIHAQLHIIHQSKPKSILGDNTQILNQNSNQGMRFNTEKKVKNLNFLNASENPLIKPLHLDQKLDLRIVDALQDVDQREVPQEDSINLHHSFSSLKMRKKCKENMNPSLQNIN